MDKTKVAVNLFNKLALEYQSKFMDVNLYANTFDFFCEQIVKKQATVLELACGPGNITKYLLAKRPDLNITGIDLAPNMIELAKVNNPEAIFLLMDCRAIHTINKNFDAILCGFCLPYLSKSEVIKLIENAAQLLSNRGVFYLSTMEGDYSKSGLEKGSTGEEIFMHYHQADYLIHALEQNNFDVLKVERKKQLSSKGEEIVDLILIAEKVSA